MKECPSGQTLSTNNHLIVQCILDMKAQHQEMCLLLRKQEEERQKLHAEMDRIAYKLVLLNKSILQRTKNIESYEKTIAEAESRYGDLVISSQFLAKALKENAEHLDDIAADKKVGTEAAGDQTRNDSEKHN